MNEGFFCERDLFLHSGKFLFGLGEGFVGLGEELLFLVNLGGQSVQSLLLPLDFELGDGQVFFSAATVSYTHLDVYKRQIVCSKVKDLRSGAEAKASLKRALSCI